MVVERATTEPGGNETPDEINSSPYYLDFELARNESYHRSEMQFYFYASRAVAIVSFLAAGSAAGNLIKVVPPWVGALLTLLAGALVGLDRRLKFDLQKEFHARKMTKYATWRADLNEQRKDSAFVRKLRATMEHEWADPANKYTLHFGVDAQAYNDAVLQLFPEGRQRRSHMLDLLWWEQLVAHIVPFNRERFLRRRDNLAAAAWLRFGAGLFWSSIVVAAGALFYWLRPEITILPSPGHYLVDCAVAICFFFLIDTAYHKTKWAFYPR
jgi:hypothetical protein